MTTNKEDIRRWLDLYMEGKTSLEEEALLTEYFRSPDADKDFADFKTMFDQFDVLTVKEADQKGRTVRLTGQKATPNKNARVFQFTFDADFFFVVTPPEIPFMENLDQTEEVK